MAKLRNTIYIEFFTVDNLTVPKSTGTVTLSDVILRTGIDTIPTLSLKIPLESFPTDELDKVGAGEYYEPRMQRYVLVVHIYSEGVEKYTFRGIIDKMDIDYANYSVQLSLSHEVARMREWAMPVNYSVKNMPIDFAISKNGAALGYSNPIDGETMQTYNSEVEFIYKGFDSGMPTVEMTFGSNNKLAALSEILENTEFCHFYVPLLNDKSTIVIENFDTPLSQTAVSGELTFSPYRFDIDECDEPIDDYQVTMLTEPQFNVDYTDHYNRAIVFCGDIQDGVHHLTLEPIFNDLSLQIDGFPVKRYDYSLDLQPEPEYDENGHKINNEKIYNEYDVIAYTSNTNREYYVEDSRQLADDSNIILNTTFNFSDLYPIPNLSQDIDDDGTMEELTITDDARIKIAEQAYLRAIRKLKAQRPQRVYQFNSTALPVGITPGTSARLSYSKSVNQEDEDCDATYHKRKVLNINEKMYLTEFTATFDSGMNETDTISLDIEIRPHDISATEIELIEAAGTDDGGGTVAGQQTILGNYGAERKRDTLFSDASGAYGNIEHTLAEAERLD